MISEYNFLNPEDEDKLIKLREDLKQRFTSGNSIDVHSTLLNRKDWELINKTINTVIAKLF